MTTLDGYGGWPGILAVLAAGRDIGTGEARAALGAILAGEATDAQIAAFIVALRLKGPAVGELLGLVGAMVIGPRVGKYVQNGSGLTARAIPGHSLPLASLGVFILWFGWFGFNAGSTVAGTDLSIALIALNTNVAAAAGAVGALFTAWIWFRKPDPTFALNGAIAGLVSITAGCAFVAPAMAVLIGLLGGVLVVLSVELLDKVCKIDDPIGAVSAHGVCGAWGTLAVGLFANEAIGGVSGLFFGGGLIPLYLLVMKLGMLNTIWAVVLPAAISAYNVIILRTVFQAVPQAMEESAYLDGANDIRILVSIVMPVSKAALATIGLFYLVSHWNSWFYAVIFLKDHDLKPLQVVLRNIVLEQGLIAEELDINESDMQAMRLVPSRDSFINYEKLKHATLIAAMLPMLIVYPFIQRYFAKGVMIGSLKA